MIAFGDHGVIGKYHMRISRRFKTQEYGVPLIHMVYIDRKPESLHEPDPTDAEYELLCESDLNILVIQMI